MYPPRASYRIQLSPHFGFDAAARQVPHLARLGISHLYLSPIFEAVPGSQHGYDVADPHLIRHELGGEPGFDRLVDVCHSNGLEIILDIVPNHMAASHYNPWWYDVLRRGQESRFASYFDIFWDEADGKIILPVLAHSLDDEVNAGAFTIDDSGRGIDLLYFDRRFPLAESSITSVSEGLTAANLPELLDLQHYRLVQWRDGLSRLNYRRFFDIADLVCLRMAEPEVFADYHSLVIELVREGKIHGLRVDHVDGLREPARYLARLRDAVQPTRPYIIVEKVLAADEEYPGHWQADGTTGYGWLNRANGVFVCPNALPRLHELQCEVSGQECEYGEIVRQSKLEVSTRQLGAELARLSRRASAIGENLSYAGVTQGELTRAICVATSQLGTYRTYIGDLGADGYDSDAVIDDVFRQVEDLENVPASAAELLRCILKREVPANVLALATGFAERWQQFTSAVMAKGVEDTAAYRYSALISMNEVGGEPSPIFASVDRFHSFNAAAAVAGRRSLLATSTHDSKLSEDARARIDVISEMPGVWRDGVREWIQLNGGTAEAAGAGRRPSPNCELRFYQVLAGILPQPGEDADFAAITQRVTAHMVKAAREEKLETNWLEPDGEYEAGLRSFVQAALESSAGRQFRDSFSPIAGRIAFQGAVNSLGLLVLKCASPGVPDFYQGAETWTFNLVDPDNRRPVDWTRSNEMLAELAPLPKERWASTSRRLWTQWASGAIKLWVTWRSLETRAHLRNLFDDGTYRALSSTGDHAENICTFERRHGDRRAIAAVARFSTSLGETPEALCTANTWQGTAVVLPDTKNGRYEDVLTGRVLVAESGLLRADDLFEVLPVALLVDSGA